jgi:hypothetical protein
MSQLYPTFKVALLRGFFAGEIFPNDVLLKVCFVGESFVFNAEHTTLDEISGVEVPGVLIPSASITSTAVVTAPSLIPALEGITDPVNVAAMVVYAEDAVTGDTQLIGVIDSLLEGTLPMLVDTPTLNLRWPSGGIFGI